MQHVSAHKILLLNIATFYHHKIICHAWNMIQNRLLKIDNDETGRHLGIPTFFFIVDGEDSYIYVYKLTIEIL